MQHRSRRSFLTLAGLAAGSTLLDVNRSNNNGVAERAALLAHAEAICGIPVRREISPELRRALTRKPKAQDFI